MDRRGVSRFSCAVCGVEMSRHGGWFLVVENRWLDRIKVLAWHPVLARQTAMRSVCGEEHLKTLLTHWLTHANLRVLAAAPPPWSDNNESGPAEAGTTSPIGKVVGELAVHRESLSRVWTGSPQALECIVNALVHGVGARAYARSATPANA